MWTRINNRTVATRSLAAVVLLGGSFLAWTQQRAPLQLEAVKGNLHMIVGSGGNVGVLVTDSGVVMIDDKFERNVEEMLGLIADETDQPVRYVVNTHHHGDHSGGNAKLINDSGVTAAAHENARANLVRNDQPGAQQFVYGEQASLFLGQDEVRLLYFGAGHTNGDSVVYFPRLRAVHMGDLFVGGAPFIDYNNGGSALEWDETLNAVLQLEFDTVIPGHGPVSTREDLVEWKEKFETYRERIGDMARDGKTAEEIRAEADLSDLGGWQIGGLQARSLPGMMRELR